MTRLVVVVGLRRVTGGRLVSIWSKVWGTVLVVRVMVSWVEIRGSLARGWSWILAAIMVAEILVLPGWGITLRNLVNITRITRSHFKIKKNKNFQKLFGEEDRFGS